MTPGLNQPLTGRGDPPPIRRISRALAIAVAAAVLAGCGPKPPQAPPVAARKLGNATSAISSDCGEAYQVSAFPPVDRRELAALDADASTAARRLAAVYRVNPTWIYQGEKVHTVARDALSMLRACGLHHAAATLVRSTR